MIQILLIGIGAGAASALLFASVASGSPISLLLANLAPLPILIAAMGWSHWAGLVAAVTASLALGSVLGLSLFVAFMLGVGLPAWWLGYLALLARPGGERGETLEWYPVGHLVTWSALLGAAVAIGGTINFGSDETMVKGIRTALERMVTATAREPMAPADLERMVGLLVSLLPPVAAVLTTLTNLINLWLANRVVAISGRLRRPPPDLRAMRFPAWAPLLIAIALAGTMLGGLPGLVAGIFAAALFTAYAVLGFAVLHAITMAVRHRRLILASTYVATIVFGWPVLMMALLGLLDTALDLRGRVARRLPPNDPRS